LQVCTSYMYQNRDKHSSQALPPPAELRELKPSEQEPQGEGQTTKKKAQRTKAPSSNLLKKATRTQ
jgi:hypothetical protein